MFTMMKITGDVILVFGCIALVIGIQTIASDQRLAAELELLFKTGMLPMTIQLTAGSLWILSGSLLLGFAQIVWAIAAMAEHIVLRKQP